MTATQITEGGTQTKTIPELACSRASDIQPYAYYFSTIHILLSLTATLGNSLILVALSKESSLHPPSKVLYRCLATTDLLVGLVVHPLAVIHFMSYIHEDWGRCRWTYHAALISGYALSSVSLLTMTAISVDRLLALLLGLRYRQIVTVKRIHVILTTFWIANGVVALCQSLNYHIIFWYGFLVTVSCLMISFASYTKIFRALSRHQTQIQDHDQQHPSQPNALNIARYRKAVYNALWVQLALFVCYLPYCILVILITFSKIPLIHSSVSVAALTVAFVSFNSTLNPFIYCWKISEVRQAVKKTLRQALCCS